MSKGFHPDRYFELRQKAEAVIREVEHDAGVELPGVKQLLHELNVHQIELEMQNEELLRARAELGEARNRYKRLFEHAPVGYFVADRRGIIISANLRLCEILDRQAEELRSKGLWTLASEGHRDELRRVVTTRRLAEVRTQFEAAGNTLLLLLRMEPKIEGGSGHEYLGSVIDVTQLHRAQQALEQAKEAAQRTSRELDRSNKDLEQFAYVASHDLQEPLRAVVAFLNLLRERCAQLGIDDTKARQYMEQAVEGGQRMQTLIRDLLKYSRVNVQPQEVVIVDMADVVRRALDNLTFHVQQTGAQVALGELPPVPGDRVQLTQLFQNLLSNAIKFHKDGVPPRVQVDAVDDGGVVVFRVKDNGIGLDARFSQRIFQLFQRLHGREEYGGTGIGLAVCKKIVERHGGHMWVESSPGNGATFCFALPKPAKDAAVPPEAPSEGDAPG
jgi:PAS domain S-box-containing protein